MKTATTVEELPALLGGAPVGTTFKIEGYVDSSGVTKDLLVKTLGPDDYARMKKESIEILKKNPAPEIPGFHPMLVGQAVSALISSYTETTEGGHKRDFKDPYTVAPEGGYSKKEGESAVYLLRVEDVAPGKRTSTDTRVDLVRAKSAVVRELDLPAGRYMHTIKLAEGRFKSVQRV